MRPRRAGELLGRPVAYGKLDALDYPLAERSSRCAWSTTRGHRGPAQGCQRHRGPFTPESRGSSRHQRKLVRAAMEAEFIRRNLGVSYNSIVTCTARSCTTRNTTRTAIRRSPARRCGRRNRRRLGRRCHAHMAGQRTLLVHQRTSTSGPPRPAERDRAVRPGVPSATCISGRPAHRRWSSQSGGTARQIPLNWSPMAWWLSFRMGSATCLGWTCTTGRLGDRATYAPGRTRSTEPGLRTLRLDRDLCPAWPSPSNPLVPSPGHSPTIPRARPWPAIGCGAPAGRLRDVLAFA